MLEVLNVMVENGFAASPGSAGEGQWGGGDGMLGGDL